MAEKIMRFIMLTLILFTGEEILLAENDQVLEGKVVIATKVRPDSGVEGDRFPSLYIWELKEDRYYKLITFSSESGIDLDYSKWVEIEWPRWSPDGGKIIFVYKDYKKSYDYKKRENIIFMINADGTELRKIYTSVGKLVSALSFSPDGRWVIFIEDHEIYTLNIHSGEIKQLTNNYEIKEKNGNILRLYSLCLSSNGQKIAFTGGVIDMINDKIVKEGIFVMDKNNLEIRVIKDFGTFTPIQDIRYSPNNSAKIAFCRSDGKNMGIYICNSDGKDEIRIKKRGSFREICWSSDGKKLMYSSAIWGDYSILPPLWDPETRLKIINVDGTKDRLIRRIVGDPHATFDWWTPKKEE